MFVMLVVLAHHVSDPCDASFEPLMLNQLEINGGEALEDLSHGSVMWQGQVGHWAAPLWGRPAWPSGPKAPYHVHLPHLSIFFTILHRFCYNSCIQIILQVQVEIGEL